MPNEGLLGKLLEICAPESVRIRNDRRFHLHVHLLSRRASMQMIAIHSGGVPVPPISPGAEYSLPASVNCGMGRTPNVSNPSRFFSPATGKGAGGN